MEHQQPSKSNRKILSHPTKVRELTISQNFSYPKFIFKKKGFRIECNYSARYVPLIKYLKVTTENLFHCNFDYLRESEIICRNSKRLLFNNVSFANQNLCFNQNFSRILTFGTYLKLNHKRFSTDTFCTSKTIFPSKIKSKFLISSKINPKSVLLIESNSSDPRIHNLDSILSDLKSNSEEYFKKSIRNIFEAIKFMHLDLCATIIELREDRVFIETYNTDFAIIPHRDIMYKNENSNHEKSKIRDIEYQKSQKTSLSIDKLDCLLFGSKAIFMLIESHEIIERFTSIAQKRNSPLEIIEEFGNSLVSFLTKKVGKFSIPINLGVYLLEKNANFRIQI